MAQYEPDFGDLLKSITDRIDTLERRAQVTPGAPALKIIGFTDTATMADLHWSSSASGFTTDASLLLASEVTLEVRIQVTAQMSLWPQAGSYIGFRHQLLVNGSYVDERLAALTAAGTTQLETAFIHDRIETLPPGSNIISAQRQTEAVGAGQGWRRGGLLSLQVLRIVN